MRKKIALFLGVVMIVLGLVVLWRSFFGEGPVTTTRGLDVAFALFFILRGAMNVRAARRWTGGPPVEPRTE